MDEIKHEEGKQINNGNRKTVGLSIFALITFVGIISVFFYLRYKSTHISTDDAFIDGNIHTIAPKINGTVKVVLVKDNQAVKKGDVLVEIDATDYDVRVKEAQASLNAEKAKLGEVDARIDAAKRQLDDARAKADAIRAVNELQAANLEQAEKDMARAEILLKKEAMPREKYEKTITANKVALAQVKAATEGLKSYISTVETQKAMIKQAEAAKTAQMSSIMQKEAALETTKLSAGYARLVAPADGYITKKSVETGNQVQAGQPLMAVVSLDDVHVIANYKETQLEKVRVGQKVEIKVDTYPGKKVQGKIESIMAGTGGVFSLFPAENATGNFVKVVQRVPVKIVFDRNTDPGHVLRVGMSVEATVLVEN